MLLLCSRSSRCVSDMAAISWQWGGCFVLVRYDRWWFPLLTSGFLLVSPTSGLRTYLDLSLVAPLTLHRGTAYEEAHWPAVRCCSERVSLMVAARFHSIRNRQAAQVELSYE